MPTSNRTRLDAYLAAEAKILGGQTVRFGDRELRMADLAEIRAEIKRLERLVAAEENPRRGGMFAQADFGGRQ